MSFPVRTDYGIPIFQLLDFNETPGRSNHRILIEWPSSRASDSLNVSINAKHTLLSATLSDNLQPVWMLLVFIS